MNDSILQPAETSPVAGPTKRKSVSKRAVLAATLLMSSGLALVGFGLGSGVAQAAPGPAPQHYWHFCDWDQHWYFFDWDWDHYCHYDFDDYHDYDHHDHHDH